MDTVNCQLNLIIHWTLLVHRQEIELYALISIDLVSSIVEIIQIENKSALHTLT
jgi:hypothetical protein